MINPLGGPFDLPRGLPGLLSRQDSPQPRCDEDAILVQNKNGPCAVIVVVEVAAGNSVEGSFARDRFELVARPLPLELPFVEPV